jgi:uncharacterized protein YaiI (UPF0178 family)
MDTLSTKRIKKRAAESDDWVVVNQQSKSKRTRASPAKLRGNAGNKTPGSNQSSNTIGSDLPESNLSDKTKIDDTNQLSFSGDNTEQITGNGETPNDSTSESSFEDEEFMDQSTSEAIAQPAINLTTDNLQPVLLNYPINPKGLKSFEQYLDIKKARSSEIKEWGTLVTASAKRIISTNLIASVKNGTITNITDEQALNFCTIDIKVLLPILYTLFSTSGVKTLVTKLNNLSFKFQIDNPNLINNLMEQVYNAYDYDLNAQAFDVETVKAQIKIIERKIKSEGGKTFMDKLHAKSSSYPLDTMQNFFIAAMAEFSSVRTAAVSMSEYGYCTVSTDTRNANHPKPTKPEGKPQAQHHGAKSSTPKAVNSAGTTSPLLCKGCGRGHGGQCNFSKHPDFNKSALPWDQSTTGKLWAAKGKPVLPITTTLSGEPYQPPPYKGKTPKSGKHDLYYLASLTMDDVIHDLVPMTMSYNHITINIMSLIDTGALQANYVSERIANELGIIPDGPVLVVSSGMNNVGSLKSKGNCSVIVIYYNELSNCYEPIEIQATILDIPFDLIIGKPTIKQFKLLQKVHDQFWGNNDQSGIEENTMLGRHSLTSHESLLAVQLIATTQDRENSLTRELFEEDIEYVSSSNLPLDLGDSKESISNIPTDIHGDAELRERLINLCHRYEEIFSREVRPTPADIPPLEIDVDLLKWHRNSNRAPPRPMTISKQLELRKQIEKLLKLNVIERSTAPFYSQVLLIPKPNNKWRFCLDYRNLNDATSYTSAWPLPNIEQMINRIGSHTPQYFGIMDLTSGYHQAPLAQSSRIFSSFICFMGVFQWTRVAMGMKGAASYFQEQLATVVLAGILYIICELYLDDVIVYGNTKDEFVERLTQVFERFRTHNITLNPDKVTLGVHQIEYVGHLINSTGHSFTQDKIDSVLNFVRPLTVANMQSFIGLVNYFSTHLRDYNKLIQPIREMIPKKASSSSILHWNTNTIAAYETILKAFDNIPTLYFVDPQAEIFLETDACDHGIGAYLYQIVENKQKPIRFLSKALSGAQLNWSTIEKEAYAIYYSITKLEHLLRDVKFILLTDHINLTFIDKGKGKVLRWKLELQEFNFSTQHISGTRNNVADSFSRLCAMSASEVLNDHIRIPDDVHKTLKKIHNTHVGHFGEEITLSRYLKQGNSMPYIREYVKRFIKMCSCCQKMSKLKLPLTVNKFTTSSYTSMQCLNIDTIGPLPTSRNGFEYILVIIDTFTRWIEIYPTHSTTAADAARCLIQHLGRYGLPSTLRSDRGTQFVNDTIQSLLQLLHIEQQLSIAYSKEENAIVERSNQEVMRHLRAFILDSKIINEWEDYLPLVMRIINSKVHHTTGVAPAHLLFGYQFDLDRSIINPNIVPSEITLNQFVLDMQSKQQKAIEVAESHLRAHDKSHLSSNSLPSTVFPPDSYVLLDYAESEAIPHKLAPKRRGPYRVIRSVGNQYDILDLGTFKPLSVHVKRLRPYHYDKHETDPRQVASQDKQMFDVLKIHKHKGSKTKISTLKFLVEWRFFPDPDTYTWEPWSPLRSNAVLHQYLRDNKLGNLIPKQFR